MLCLIAINDRYSFSLAIDNQPTVHCLLLHPMKVLMRSRFVVMSVLFLIFLTLSLFTFNSLPVYADNLPARDALNQATISMDIAMSSIPMTGNPDVDFAAMMVSHHQGAVDMAKVELRYGTDSRLRRLAQEIIVTQQSEIAVMRLILEHSLSTQSQ